MTRSCEIRIGIGGWAFEPWRGVFHPENLKQKDELNYASRHLTAIEITAVMGREPTWAARLEADIGGATDGRTRPTSAMVGSGRWCPTMRM